MPRTLTSLVGKKFGKLLVLNISNNDKWSNPMWLCKCDCGKTKIVRGSSLRNGLTQTCGCSRSGNLYALKHGMSNTSTYNIWSSMKDRCLNPHDVAYKYYGGRGIKVCTRWLKFENFLSDMGERPQGLTLDRIDNDKNYELSNCRWTTYHQQILNSKRYPKQSILTPTERDRLYHNFGITP